MFLVVKKKGIIITILLVMMVGLIGMAFTTKDVKNTINNMPSKLKPVYMVETNKKEIAISFDAAWGADKSETILSILDKFNVKATFFLVGFWVDKYSDLVKKIVENGHEIGNHSENHLDFTTLSENEIKNEVLPLNKRIEEICNQKPKVFRFPYGAYNSKTVKVLIENEMVPVQWSVDTLDWKGIGEREILDRVKKGIRSGGIILFHNNSDHVIEALPLVISYLLNEGYEFKKMSELVHLENYFVDNQGVQHLK